ncbi:hypothetical protein HMPREF9103_02209 [Lentilactobacillus parafarraginis F0439]|uniref:Uncharacterized protein n=1 Tax=Lentilactobacillus parafarraginis F0439 TaxID=797515 RepID=G9ZR48_9LACO|nr:hypothetical protein HMPREF9103_02209 [Lentilactobacillus parafarraginis F0439]
MRFLFNLVKSFGDISGQMFLNTFVIGIATTFCNTGEALTALTKGDKF